MEAAIESIDDAICRINVLLNATDSRLVLGIVGEPGAGKSTFTNQILGILDSDVATSVPMDGFHYSNKVLASLGRHERKGAPDTFDVASFTALLERIKTERSSDIYFPVFHREIEESIAAEGVVKAATRLVITEGNYLLLDEGGWSGVSALLDETWFLVIDGQVRRDRLIARHQLFGKDSETARKWTLGSDENNAKIIERTKYRADKLVTLVNNAD